MDDRPQSDSPAGPLTIEVQGEIALLTLNRPHKRNALDDTAVLALESFFAAVPSAVRVAVLQAAGDHFSAGLDLTTIDTTSLDAAVARSRLWHRAFATIEHGRVPVIAVLKGGVVGGGLELACATHVRVAERSAFYALPEGQRGIFVGGGGAVRIARVIGVSRMQDLMLTGRVYTADEGQAVALSHYLVDPGSGLAKAMDLARAIAANPPLTNFAITQVLPRIGEMGSEPGLLTESLIAAMTATSPDARDGVRKFLDKRAGKIRSPAEKS